MIKFSLRRVPIETGVQNVVLMFKSYIFIYHQSPILCPNKTKEHSPAHVVTVKNSVLSHQQHLIVISDLVKYLGSMAFSDIIIGTNQDGSNGSYIPLQLLLAGDMQFKKQNYKEP